MRFKIKFRNSQFLILNSQFNQMIRDRRGGKDRRNTTRYAANVDVYWESLSGRQTGTISDISETGCFVLCSGAVEDGEYIRVYFLLHDKTEISLPGKVVNHIYEIGFALQFSALSLNERSFLKKYIAQLGENR